MLLVLLICFPSLSASLQSLITCCLYAKHSFICCLSIFFSLNFLFSFVFLSLFYYYFLCLTSSHTLSSVISVYYFSCQSLHHFLHPRAATLISRLQDSWKCLNFNVFFWVLFLINLMLQNLRHIHVFFITFWCLTFHHTINPYMQIKFQFYCNKLYLNFICNKLLLNFKSLKVWKDEFLMKSILNDLFKIEEILLPENFFVKLNQYSIVKLFKRFFKNFVFTEILCVILNTI